MVTSLATISPPAPWTLHLFLPGPAPTPKLIPDPGPDPDHVFYPVPALHPANGANQTALPSSRN